MWWFMWCGEALAGLICKEPCCHVKERCSLTDPRVIRESCDHLESCDQGILRPSRDQGIL